MNVGSLFSGIGGIELGFEAEGFTCSWNVEKEPYQQEILKRDFAHATLYGDITRVDFTAIQKTNIVVGGFPCQDISKSGRGAGIKGSRSSLWSYFCKAISTIRPEYALIENVPVLTKRGLHVVLADLARIGYDAEWHCVPASAIGACFEGKRIYIIATPMRKRSSRIFKESKHQKIKQLTPFPRELVERRYSKLSEPCFLGKGVRLPFRKNRTECLGNAVVPQVAQIFAQAIKIIETQRGDT